MLGQSKNMYQAEIDAACELIDFLKFNVYFGSKLLEQPISTPATFLKRESAVARKPNIKLTGEIDLWVEELNKRSFMLSKPPTEGVDRRFLGLSAGFALPTEVDIEQSGRDFVAHVTYADGMKRDISGKLPSAEDNLAVLDCIVNVADATYDRWMRGQATVKDVLAAADKLELLSTFHSETSLNVRERLEETLYRLRSNPSMIDLQAPSRLP